MIYLLTGSPGAGKSTVAVQHAIYRYAKNGRRVVVNFPLDFAPICTRRDSKLSKASAWVLPDRPTRADLDAIGHGGETEEDAGLLVIDEAGTWLNARSWQGQEREAIIDWLTQSRKRRWDIILIAQAALMLDKQVREAVCECVARIRRLDRVRLLGVRMPRVHFAIVRYGLDQNAPVTERWIYQGKEAQRCFGSYRLFGADSGHYSVLPASLSKWRYLRPFGWRDAQRLFTAVLGAVFVGFGLARWSELFPSPRKVPASRLSPLYRLPPAVRWTATRRLVERGLL